MILKLCKYDLPIAVRILILGVGVSHGIWLQTRLVLRSPGQPSNPYPQILHGRRYLKCQILQPTLSRPHTIAILSLMAFGGPSCCVSPRGHHAPPFYGLSPAGY